MLGSRRGRAIAAVLSMCAFQGLQVSAASAQTSNECSAYSIRVCAGGDLGYSSLKECRLTEYANCMAGVPPVVETAYQPGAIINVTPKSVAAKYRPLEKLI
ncbi:MAG: hypothetical protein ABW128_23895 [Rhizorhabdus sp.]